MKIGVVRAFAAAALLACAGGSAQAQDLTVSFKGTVNYVSGSAPNDIVVGTTFTGYYTYNLATPNTSGNPQIGYYLHTMAPYGVTVALGAHTFKTNPANVNFNISTANDWYNQDSVGFSSHGNEAVDGVGIQFINWGAGDQTMTALTNADLPSTSWPLSSWQYNNFSISAFGETPNGLVYYDVTRHDRGDAAECFEDGESLLRASRARQGWNAPIVARLPTGGNLAALDGQLNTVLSTPRQRSAIRARGVEAENQRRSMDADRRPRARRRARARAVRRKRELAVPGPQGPAGPQGESLTSGSMLTLAAGTPPPAGYIYVGKYTLLPALQNPPQGPLVMYLYRKD